MAGFILAGLSVEHLSSLAALYIAIGGLGNISLCSVGQYVHIGMEME